MSQPTQQLPPWLQPSVVVVTDAGGAPVATNTEIVYVPPTYFGPSIPLGSLYIFGGTTEPPTIVFTPTSTAANSATPTATPPTTAPLTTTATPSTNVPTTSTAITSSPSSSATPSTSAIISNSASSSSSASAASSTASSSSSTAASSTGSSIPGSSSLTPTPVAPTTTVSATQPPTQTFSAPPTITATPARIGGLTKGQLVGVIVASILGLIFLFVLALFLCLWCKGRRNRRHRFQSLSPGGEDSYVFVPAGTRVPGEGSPRHSGEEADPFLQQSGASNWVSEFSPTAAGAAAAGTANSRGSYRSSPLANVAAIAEPSNGNANGNGQRNMAQVAGAAAAVTRPAVSRVPPPTMGSNSSGTASTVSHASGFGVLLDRPSLGGIAYMPITYEHQAEGGGRPLSQADLARIDNEQVLPHEDIDDANHHHYSGAYAYSRYSEPGAAHAPPTAPPRLVIPGATPSPEHLPFSISNPSSLQDLQEASLQTATRVKAQDLAPRSSIAAGDASARSTRRGSGFLGALGLGGMGAWFAKSSSGSGNGDSPRRSVGREHSSPLLGEKDLEQGALFAPDSNEKLAVDSLGLRPAGTGLTADGRRPVSNVSGRSAASGGTVFHDAYSSLPATPATPFLAPLPRAVTPAEPSPTMPVPVHMDEQAWYASASHDRAAAHRSRTPSPPQEPSHTTTTTTTRTSYDMDMDMDMADADADILDMPAPGSALHHFSSGSSLKQMDTGSSAGGGGVKLVTPFPPPGLSTVRPVGWVKAANAAVPPNVGTEPQGLAQAETTSYPSPPASLGSGSEFGGLRGLNLGRGMTMDLDMDMDMEDDLGLGHGISIDVLEEAPPGAEQGWRSISSAGTGGPAAYMDNGRLGTFGTLVHGLGYASEQGSLHSMRSHVTPGSMRSTGSAATRPDLSLASVSSGRPSLGTSNTGAAVAQYNNLTRTGSLTADNQQRGRRSQGPMLVPAIGASPAGTAGKAHTVRTVTSDTTVTAADANVRPARSLSPLGGPDFPLNAPWAGGLDNDWQASV